MKRGNKCEFKIGDLVILDDLTDDRFAGFNNSNLGSLGRVKNITSYLLPATDCIEINWIKFEGTGRSDYSVWHWRYKRLNKQIMKKYNLSEDKIMAMMI